jgi:hypothetical protein
MLQPVTSTTRPDMITRGWIESVESMVLSASVVLGLYIVVRRDSRYLDNAKIVAIGGARRCESLWPDTSEFHLACKLRRCRTASRKLRIAAQPSRPMRKVRFHQEHRIHLPPCASLFCVIVGFRRQRLQCGCIAAGLELEMRLRGRLWRGPPMICWDSSERASLSGLRLFPGPVFLKHRWKRPSSFRCSFRCMHMQFSDADRELIIDNVSNFEWVFNKLKPPTKIWTESLDEQDDSIGTTRKHVSLR